jgi:hypothetical protein
MTHRFSEMCSEILANTSSKIQRTIASSAPGGNKVGGIRKKAASALIKKADGGCKAVY